MYINVTGGLELDDTAADLAVAVSLISSVTDKEVPEGTVAFGEIGLGGEVRTVNSIEKRIAEVARLGFKRCVIPHSALRKLDRGSFGIELVGVNSVRDIGKLFK